ncbi:hypothetical protein ACU4GD_00110 [Cupriavidus basilensis]
MVNARNTLQQREHGDAEQRMAFDEQRVRALISPYRCNGAG